MTTLKSAMLEAFYYKRRVSMARMSIHLSFLAMILLALSGCDKDRDEKENKHESHSADARTSEKYRKIAAPNVSGKWVGTWTSGKDKSHGGALSCEATEKNKNEWEAVFTAEYGKTSKYNVLLKGKPEGDKVAFGGKVDLGKEPGGGVFTWTGRATETEFTGEYEGGGDTGSFKMTRK
jgi:hypothetical protein